eukprot:5343922-Pleurochrysis_carterae.AAC.1
MGETVGAPAAVPHVHLAAGADVQPQDLRRVVASVERQHLAKLLRAVEMECCRLHPRVVRVARVVDVPT